MKLPTLYKKTSTGAIQTWSIHTIENKIIVDFGHEGSCRMQRTSDVITSGKNLGRSNATTPVQQAELEAKAQWDGKLKKGYVLTSDMAREGKVDTSVITGGINPMLAHPYAKQGHKIVYPAYAQPKLDGHRCIAIVEGNKATLWSRTRKPINSMPHIVKEIESLELGDAILDGELYNHSYRNNFEELTSLIRPEEPKPGCEVVQYHVYDTVNEEEFSTRYLQLRDMVANANDYISLVYTEVVTNEQEAAEIFVRFREQGYEGAILRNGASPYVNKRSYDLQKMKEFDDSEFEIVDVVPGRGKLTNMGMFICKTEAGDTFEVKMMGELESLKPYLANKQKYIGKVLTVQHQGMSAYGKPRFGVGLRFREDV